MTTLPSLPPATLHFDGSCKPNPGPMGIGYVIRPITGPVEGQGLIAPIRVGTNLGEGTNNEAEYLAVIAGLRHAIRHGFWNLKLVSDSLLLVKQMSGVWKVRDPILRRHHGEAMGLTYVLSSSAIQYVPREENTEADELSRLIHFEEPTLPSPGVYHGRERAFLPFQAAFIRYHWQAGIKNKAFFARIFGTSPQQIEDIGDGKFYKEATFEGMEQRFQ